MFSRMRVYRPAARPLTFFPPSLTLSPELAKCHFSLFIFVPLCPEVCLTTAQQWQLSGRLQFLLYIVSHVHTYKATAVCFASTTLQYSYF